MPCVAIPDQLHPAASFLPDSLQQRVPTQQPLGRLLNLLERAQMLFQHMIRDLKRENVQVVSPRLGSRVNTWIVAYFASCALSSPQTLSCASGEEWKRRVCTHPTATNHSILRSKTTDYGNDVLLFKANGQIATSMPAGTHRERESQLAQKPHELSAHPR